MLVAPAAPVPVLVLEPRGVEVGLELLGTALPELVLPEPPVGVVEPVEPELLEEPLLEEAVVSEPLVLVSVAVALVSAGALLVVAEPESVVVAIGGTEMGWPAEEHWETTMLETASRC